MQLQAASNLAQRCWQRSMRDRHSQIIAIGALGLLLYTPTWLGVIGRGIMQGHSDSIINFGLFALATKILYRQRNHLRAYNAQADDRFLGYGLMGVGAVTLLHYLLNFSSSFQALAAMLLVIGMALSSWGFSSWKILAAPIVYALIGLYPDTLYIAIRICRFFTGENALEQVMAWAGSFPLNWLGYKAIADGLFVRLPAGSILVASGCSGFDMAYTLMACSFLLGKFMGASGKRIASLTAIAWALALICNVPRISLLTIASVYWGKESFDFWHGPIGGQIFSMGLFTIYYYIAMAIIPTNPKTVTSSPVSVVMPNIAPPEVEYDRVER